MKTLRTALVAAAVAMTAQAMCQVLPRQGGQVMVFGCYVFPTAPGRNFCEPHVHWSFDTSEQCEDGIRRWLRAPASGPNGYFQFSYRCFERTPTWTEIEPQSSTQANSDQAKSRRS